MSKILEETSAELAQESKASAEDAAPAATIAPAEIGQALSDSDIPAEAAAPDTVQEPAPTLEYEEIPEPIPEAKPQTEFKVQLVKKKSRKGGVIALAALVAVAGLGAAAYKLGVFEGTDSFTGIGVRNVTEMPEGASVPAFSPIDPLEFVAASDDAFITVPDETGLEIPAFGHGPQVITERQNYYIQAPNVSTFFTRAAQDETYVYFLQDPAETKYSLYNLMRVNPSTGKAETVDNANEIKNRIYSFALYGQNIITCEYKPSTDSFAFYRVPKTVEDAQLLFETDSPAYINVFDDKLFMLFVEEQSLGVFDFAADTEPSYIALEPLGETAHYFPQFSVVNGYLYYGIWYDTSAASETDTADDSEEGAEAAGENGSQVSMEYLRRSLYTGETVTLLSGTADNAAWNPCWDDANTAYYAQHASDAMEFRLIAAKSGANPQTVSPFDYDGNWPSVAFKDDFFVAALPGENIRQYNREDFSVKLEVAAESQPFAATKDYLVTDSGIYRLFDLGFIPFSS